MKKVHIGITTKNRAEILPKALDSACSQSFSPIEISVFDDASSDGTKALQSQYPTVKWIFSNEPKGLVYARNLFLEISEADYFCSLDDDSWFLRNDAIDLAVQKLQEDHTIGAIAFDIKDADNADMPQRDVDIKETNLFIGCGHILRVEAVRKVGRYIPPPGYYGGEEKDLCIRLMDAGYKIIKMEGLYVWHDRSQLARNGKIQHRSGVCNDLVFAFRRTPLIVLVPSIISKVFKHLLFSVKYKKEDLLTACFQGFADFFTFLAKGKIERKPVSMATFRKFLNLPT